MGLDRRLAFVLGLATLAAARFLLTGAGDARAEIDTSIALSAEPSCGEHGCGCPHERPASACCCANPPTRGSTSPARVRGPERRAVPPVLAATGPAERNVPTLEAFRCSGGKPPSAAPSSAPVASVTSLAAREDARPEPRGWIQPIGATPPAGVALEPATPPPRSRALPRI